MRKIHSSCSGILRWAAAALVLGAPAVRAEEPPAPPGPPPAPLVARPVDGDLEVQLAIARRQLEEAAHRVAELSVQMGRPLIERFATIAGEPGHAILGVELDTAPAAGGVRVRAVSPGGPAAEAGIRAGDVIVAVNGTALTGPHPARQVVGIMRGVGPDEQVGVRVMRAGKPHEFSVAVRAGRVFFARTPGPRAFELGPLGSLPDLGFITTRSPALVDMELVTLTPQLGRYFGTDKGVLVVRSPAGGALQLEDGDVILTIDGRVPLSGSHATRILASYQPGEKVTLRIMRAHQRLELQTAMPDGDPTQDRALGGVDQERPAVRGGSRAPPDGPQVRGRRLLIGPPDDEV